MSAVASFSFSNLAWLGTQGIPLIIWPSSIGTLLRSEYETPSSLELYFARSLGFALLSLGLVIVVLSGAVPLTSAADTDANAISPFANAALVVATLHHASSAFYCYGRWNWTGETGYLLGCIGSSVFAAWGTYCVMFAGDKAMISRYHKFDQSTSGFPFKNKESYRSKKKAL